MKYLVAFFAALAAVFGLLLGRKAKQVEAEKDKNLNAKEAETAKTLAAAQIITSNTKADYEKAMADLPPDYQKPSGS